MKSKATVFSKLPRGVQALPASVWQTRLQEGLKDDGYPWDWSAECVASSSGWGPLRAHLYAKEKGIWVGSGALKACERFAKKEGMTLSYEEWVGDGTEVGPKTHIATLEANAKLLLALERPLLNLVGYASGIATSTSRLVSLVESVQLPVPPRVTSTRKTLPGYRDISVYALRCGGGHAHRLGLSSGVLLKENHISACGSIGGAIERSRAAVPHGLKIEIEVRDLEEAKLAQEANVDILLLDNFSPAQVRYAVEQVEKISLKNNRPKPLIEVSGGIREETIRDYCLKGVSVISVGGLTHSVKALDLTLLAEGLQILD